MEHVSGIRLRDIFLDNGNWWKLWIKKCHLIRYAIVINVLKMLACRTSIMGYHLFACPSCGNSKKVPHSCKSKFCSSCGKKSTDLWLKRSFEKLPNTKWQHITFTMPSEFWDFFWMNRRLMNKPPALAADIIKKLAKAQGFLPGIYLAIHSFGRDLKRNYHIHLSTTAGGLALKTMNSWIANAFFRHDDLKRMWKYEMTNLLRQEYKEGRLRLPPAFRHLNTYKKFNAWLDKHYQKTWVVHLNKQSENQKHNIEYLGKYLKRPPIGETRIKEFNHAAVTYEYLDHYTDTNKTLSLPPLEFIERLIAHIPDKNFRSIRYYGFLSNRLIGKLLPLVNQLLEKTEKALCKIATSWRDMIKESFGLDPLECDVCGNIMKLHSVRYPSMTPLLERHQEIANGYPQLL